MSEKSPKVYHPAIDVLRVLSILAVILIHTTTRVMEVTHLDVPKLQWTLFLNQGSRFAVPLFFIVSGFVLELNFDYHLSFLSYFKKRINRILVPYLFWSVLYFYFVYTSHSENIFSAILAGDASYQLYFLPSLFIFYLIFPLLHAYYKILSSTWVLISLGVIELILLYHDYFVTPITMAYPIRVSLLNYFFFFAGIILSKNHQAVTLFVAKWKYFLTFLAITLCIYIFYEGQALYEKTKNYLAIYSQWRPSIFVYSLTLATLLFYAADRTGISNKLIKTLSKLSFFVFFVHVVILELLWNLIGNTFISAHQTNNPLQLLINIIFFTLVTTISFLTAFVVHKILPLSKVTG